MRRIAILAATTVPVALAGCGGGAPETPKVAAERAIYTNAKDCAAGGKLDIDQCTTLIEKAIADHEDKAPKYASQKSCEAVEGAEKCERYGTKQFRPRLIAFLITKSTPPVAAPLYPTIEGEMGFRTADKLVLLGSDESLTISDKAVAAYEQHSAGGTKKGFF